MDGPKTLTLPMPEGEERAIAHKIDLDMQIAHAITAQRDDGAWYSVPRRFHFTHDGTVILETVFLHMAVVETENGAALAMRLGENEDPNSGSPFAASIQVFEPNETYVFAMQRPAMITMRRRS